MTSPVLQEQTASDEWTMTFILPTHYNLGNTPEPLDSDVTLEETPGYDAVAVQYRGNNSLGNIKKNERALDQWLNDQTQLCQIGKFFVARYDAPFVIRFLKRNEVLVRVSASQ